jgi:hypothetical protein
MRVSVSFLLANFSLRIAEEEKGHFTFSSQTSLAQELSVFFSLQIVDDSLEILVDVYPQIWTKQIFFVSYSQFFQTLIKPGL